MEYPGSLHGHTEYSNNRIRDAIIKPKDLLDYATELGHTVVAITDHESIASAVKIEKLKPNYPNLKIIMGNEIYLCRNGLNNENFNSNIDKYYHFVLLAKDAIGFKQICELSTRAWGRSYMGRGMRRVPTYYQDIVEIIGSNPGHVIGSTACLGGAIATQLLKPHSKWDDIVQWCQRMESIFGKGNFYLEMQPSATEEQTYVNKRILELAAQTDIPYIITCDEHYLKAADRAVHKAYLNSQDGEREVDAFYATTYLMSTKELEAHLDLTEAQLAKAYMNILNIKKMCQEYSVCKALKIPNLRWREFKVEVQPYINHIPYLQTFMDSQYYSDNELAKAVVAGIQKHSDLQNAEAYAEINDNLRITWESSNVNNARWSAYYLNLQKNIDLAWEAGTLVGPGRGSGAGFILLYVLDIIQINTLREETKTYSWRFLNPERVSVLDIDVDIEGSKRQAVLNKFREFYGADRVSQVVTFRTEKSKSAILTAARGLGIDNNEAQYLASLIPEERGQLRSLKQCYYGDSDNGYAPVTLFKRAMDNDYQELWQIAQKLEGVISGVGIHAGGVVFVDEPFYESTALMRAPDGTIVTQFELHDLEEVSLIKIDLLSVEAMDKLHVCLDLICDSGYAQRQPTLRETYEQLIGIYNLERNNEQMWQMVWDQKILSLFQMEKQSGIQGISLTHPHSVKDLAVLNSVIRLMAPDKDSETPLVTWSKYRNDINIWIQEMREFGLTTDEIEWLRNHPAISQGICEAQEGAMSLVQEERLGGHTLNFADSMRKGIAKKQGKLFEECERTFFATIKDKGCSQKLADYVWNVLLRVQRGYSFNRAHTLAYSLIALQEMNLAYKYPIIFWNTANLIVDSGSLEDNSTTEIVSIYEPEHQDLIEGTVFIDLPDRSGKIKKTSSTDYAKMAKAIGKIRSHGIKLSLIDINQSDYTFKPDVKNDEILFGLKGVNKVNDDTVEKIKAGRPYKGIVDFMQRCPLSCSVMVHLIKAGAFDKTDAAWASQVNPTNPRFAIMGYYLMHISDLKKRLTLQNFNGLIKAGIVPAALSLERDAFYINKLIKKSTYQEYYVLTPETYPFYQQNFDTDLLSIVDERILIQKKQWDKLYKTTMDKAREWLQQHQQELLEQYNTYLFTEVWNKYGSGSISAWEMESVCFYYHVHELAHIDSLHYGIVSFEDLDPTSEIERTYKRDGKQLPIYRTYKIVGTVLCKTDSKSTVTILDNYNNVIDVKFTKDYYAKYNKQLSSKDESGKKKVQEKSWFQRGQKLMLTGYRRGNMFVAKTYKHTPTHQLYKILNIDAAGQVQLQHERMEIDE